MDDKSRVEILNQPNLETRVANAIKDMRELKQSQFIGSDSIRFYKIDTADPYDWSGVPPESPQSAYTGLKNLRFTATALTQNVLFADLIVEMWVDSMSNPQYTVIDYIDGIYDEVNFFNFRLYEDAQLPGDENIQSWTVQVYSNDYDGTSLPTNTIFIKVYVVANDDVDITVTELN